MKKYSIRQKNSTQTVCHNWEKKPSHPTQKMLTPSYKKRFPHYILEKISFFIWQKIYTLELPEYNISTKNYYFFVRNWYAYESPKGFNPQQKPNFNIET